MYTHVHKYYGEALSKQIEIFENTWTMFFANQQVKFTIKGMISEGNTTNPRHTNTRHADKRQIQQI